MKVVTDLLTHSVYTTIIRSCYKQSRTTQKMTEDNEFTD